MERRFVQVQRALLSVTDKGGIVDFARGLAAHGVELISTGGTAKTLSQAQLPVTEISDFTGFPEMMGGRVKTLHPKVHGGLLAVRDNADHAAAMRKHGILAIDLVCVNLYSFEQTVAKPGCTREQAIEDIDIGGPAMIRSAAKNHRFVAVVTSPAQYSRVLQLLRENGGALPEEFLAELAGAAFLLTSRYDAAIASYLAGGDGFPNLLLPHFAKMRDLRYGENSHQAAALYAAVGEIGPCIATAELLGEGRELSFNNVLDLDRALRIIREFPPEEPFCVVIKHTNPCGGATGATAAQAWARAQAGDPVSAYGSIVGFNVPVDEDAARAMATADNFIESVLAPDFTAEAVRILTQATKWGRKLRVVKIPALYQGLGPARSYRRILGGMLVQDYDGSLVAQFQTVSVRRETPDEFRDLDFAWRIAKHVTSNAIVLVRNCQVVGVGAGQMSRVDSAWMAVRKAGERAKGAVVGSDAFFPFSDALEVCLEAGATAAIHPGGSIRDADVIVCANERGAALLTTGMRHFRH